MGILDSVKNLTKGKKPQIKQGIDKGADVIDDKVDVDHRDEVAKAADLAKDGVDKLPD
jgi:hypothetical protein